MRLFVVVVAVFCTECWDFNCMSLKVYDSRYIALSVVNGFVEKFLKGFLNCLCQYLRFSINRKLCSLNSFFNRSKVWGYPTLLISWFINFKVGLSPSKKIFFICFNDSASKMVKNAFYFILKFFLFISLFVLKIFKFLACFWVCSKNGLIRKINLWRHSLVKKELQYTCCSISHELKTTRQWNLVS